MDLYHIVAGIFEELRFIAMRNHEGYVQVLQGRGFKNAILKVLDGFEVSWVPTTE
jgi:hypothetical protein